MALKTIMLRKNIDEKRSELQALTEKDSAFSVREAELTAAIAEAESAEERQTVADAVEAFDAEKTEHQAQKDALTRELEALEAQLAAEEAAPPPNINNAAPAAKTERSVKNPMNHTIDIRSLQQCFIHT